MGVRNTDITTVSYVATTVNFTNESTQSDAWNDAIGFIVILVAIIVLVIVLMTFIIIRLDRLAWPYFKRLP